MSVVGSPILSTVEPDGALLSVRDLEVAFPSEDGRVDAVRDVSFDLARGEVLGIVGESGSGKSVTSLAIMGLLPPVAQVRGSITFDGVEMVGRSDEDMAEIRGDRMAMIFQDPLSALTPVYSIGDQIDETILIHRGGSRSAARARTLELLDLVGIPNAEQRAKAFPHEFSGGMRQRVMIAMAIANDPDLLIADEPTTALDVTIQAQVLEVLAQAQQETGAAVIMITHDLGVVAGFADRIQVMYAGRPVERGTVDEVYYRPAMPYTIGLLGAVPRLDAQATTGLAPIDGNPPSLIGLPDECPFAPRCPMAEDACRATEPELAPVGPMGDHVAACVKSNEIQSRGLTYTDIYPVPEVRASALARLPRDRRDEVLRLDGVKKQFALTKGVLRRRIGTVRAVDGVSFDIRDAEAFGLVGESGSGKTTTLLQILDLEPPIEGDISLFGRNVAELTSFAEKKETRREIQIVFQDPMAALDPRLPVFDIVAEPLRAHGLDKREVEQRVDELLELVGLEPSHGNRYPQHFSGGQRQRIGVARALALEPKLLVLDEPVSALDVSIQAGVLNLLDELRAKLDLSYLIVAHDLAVVRHVADRIGVMYLGRLVEVGDVDEVYSSPNHPYTQALLSAIPLPDPVKERERNRIILRGDLPSPAAVPSGCRFRSRCPRYLALDADQQKRCDDEDPPFESIGDDHVSACHFNAPLDVL